MRHPHRYPAAATPALTAGRAGSRPAAGLPHRLVSAFRFFRAWPIRSFCRWQRSWAPPRTLISNGARQSLFKSKPPYETSFLKKLHDRYFLQNCFLKTNSRKPRKEKVGTLFGRYSLCGWNRALANLIHAHTAIAESGVRGGGCLWLRPWAAQIKVQVHHLEATSTRRPPPSWWEVKGCPVLG